MTFHTRVRTGILLAAAGLCLMTAVGRADVHLVRINEFYTQCDDGSTNVQYIELRDYTLSQFFRQCASIEVYRTVGQDVLWSALPVFAGKQDTDLFPQNRTWLIATPGFQSRTGVVPDLIMPDGTLPVAGGVIRFAADSGCATDWGTIHEVRYGDQTLAVPNIPAPGRHQAANYNNTTNSWTLGARSPRAFDGTPTTTWTCDSTAPVVTVITANGGETWEAGSSHNITWTASDDVAVTTVKLEFSTDNGGAYTQIAAGLPNSGTFAWSVPATLTTQGLIRVTANDAANHSGVDMSNANFSIVDTTAPTVTVSSPNGAEVWTEGTTQTVTWSASDLLGVTGIDIAFSTNNGGSFTGVALGEANDGSYSWLVPSAASTQVLVRITARDGSSNAGQDVSNAVFTIQAASAVPGLPDVITRPLLLQNRPNPFNPVTFIGFALPRAGHASLNIYTLQGRLVRRLADGEFGAGYTEVRWDGHDGQDKPLPSGIYLYALEAGNYRETRKLTLNK